jgi:hypothetical protein
MKQFAGSIPGRGYWLQKAGIGYRQLIADYCFS